MHTMALRHQWLSQAETELNETLSYVFREFGKRSAEKVYMEVVERVGWLCSFPDLGVRYKDLYYKGKEVRILHMRKSSIVYCHDDEKLFVLAFWNNRNDNTVITGLLSNR